MSGQMAFAYGSRHGQDDREARLVLMSWGVPWQSVFPYLGFRFLGRSWAMLFCQKVRGSFAMTVNYLFSFRNLASHASAGWRGLLDSSSCLEKPRLQSTAEMAEAKGRCAPLLWGWGRVPGSLVSSAGGGYALRQLASRCTKDMIAMTWGRNGRELFLCDLFLLPRGRERGECRTSKREEGRAMSPRECENRDGEWAAGGRIEILFGSRCRTGRF